MAKRELSSTLRNLKFMQRAALREETTEKDDEVKLDGSFGTTVTDTRKCVVLTEGDPHPGALKGRMSFQSSNPSLDKLNEEEARFRQPVAQTISRNESENMSFRDEESSVEGPKCTNADKTTHGVNGDRKRKQSEVISQAKFPNKSPKNHRGDRISAANGLGSFKKPKGDEADWRVLRPSKRETK